MKSRVISSVAVVVAAGTWLWGCMRADPVQTRQEVYCSSRMIDLCYRAETYAAEHPGEPLPSPSHEEVCLYSGQPYLVFTSAVGSGVAGVVVSDPAPHANGKRVIVYDWQKSVVVSEESFGWMITNRFKAYPWPRVSQSGLTNKGRRGQSR